MKRKGATYYEELLESIISSSANELIEVIKLVREQNGFEDSFEDSNEVISLPELDIAQPIFREDLNGEDYSETIIGTSFDNDGSICFHINSTHGTGYKVSIGDLDVDMTIHLLSQFENILN